MGVPNEVPLRGGAQRRLDDLGASVAEQQRSPRLHEIDVAVAVDVDEEGALAAVDEHRRAAHAPEGPDRRIHPTRDHGAGAGEQVLGSGHGVDGIDRSRSGTREHDGALVPVQAQDLTVDRVRGRGLESRPKASSWASIGFAHPIKVWNNEPTEIVPPVAV